MSIEDTIKFVPERLRTRDLNIKLTSIIDFIFDKHLKELEDVKLKFRGPDQVSSEVVKEILAEGGFGYIGDLLDISPNIDANSVLAFTALITLLKGHRDGFELVLDLLNISFEVEEWWEQVPIGTPDTVALTIDLNESEIIDFFETFQLFKIFVRQYIFPILETVFVISFDFAQKNFDFAGFKEREAFGGTPELILSSHVAGFQERTVSGLIT